MFLAVKLVNYSAIDKHHYSGHGIGFNRDGTFSVGNGFRKNVILFGADLSSSVRVDSKKKYILILGKGPAQGSDDPALTF